jgi:hypothetical protein
MLSLSVLRVFLGRKVLKFSLKYNCPIMGNGGKSFERVKIE